MARPAFCESADLWQFDGSWLDLYVLRTSLSDWEAFLAFAASNGFEYCYDGESRALPSAGEVFRNQDGSHLLRVDAGVLLNCHFFQEDKIEIDLDPRLIGSKEAYNRLLGFIEDLSLALSKTVLLTPENRPDLPLMAFDPLSRVWNSFL